MTNPKILIVDDSAPMRRTIGSLLGKVAILTSYDEPGLDKIARAAGARACLLKEDLLSLRRTVAAAQ